MGFEVGTGNGGLPWGIRTMMRRKKVDSVGDSVADGHHKLAKELSVLQLMAIGVGSTIGAGVYVLVGTVAREHSGPALTISFLIAGIAAALSAFCYAELASRCPSAGSAYHYSYICIGEGVAWLIGWALILEYTVGGSAVARGISPNLALFFKGPESLPSIFARIQIPGLEIAVDPCAAFLVLLFTAFLCVGIKESAFVQTVVTTANVCVMIFVIIVGGYLGFKTGWVGYSVTSGYFPYGVDGMLSGAATVFFAYIGFDTVASTAEEVKNPQRDLPLGIGLSLFVCCFLYMLVSVVVVGLVPYFAMDPDTPISSAFAKEGMQWAAYVITAGAVLALCATLMGSIMPQPRILMAMSRDGLLPPFFSDVNKKTLVPVKSTIFTGVCAAALAFFLDLSQLAGMVSVGTLLAFTVVAVSILILRYVPPDDAPLRGTIDAISSDYLVLENGSEQEEKEGTSGANDLETSAENPFVVKENYQAKLNRQERRSKAALSIAFVCIGVVILTSAASASFLPSIVRLLISAIGGLLLLFGLVVLTWIDQDDARHNFGYAGGFTCPFVPLLPVCSLLINVYLLINLGVGTWLRVSVWLMMGVLVYLFYGRRHSSLIDAVYVTADHADEIHRSPEYVA